jgi:DNA-binding NarL/FixJ family response regulator
MSKVGVRIVVAARPSLRRTLHEALGQAGVAIAADCADAAELLAAVSRERPDVCILDRDLRGGGLSALAALAAPHPAPKILVVGGRGTSTEIRAARLAGAAGCVPSDIDAAGLAAAISELVQEEEP